MARSAPNSSSPCPPGTRQVCVPHSTNSTPRLRAAAAALRAEERAQLRAFFGRPFQTARAPDTGDDLTDTLLHSVDLAPLAVPLLVRRMRALRPSILNIHARYRAALADMLASDLAHDAQDDTRALLKKSQAIKRAVFSML